MLKIPLVLCGGMGTRFAGKQGSKYLQNLRQTIY